MGMIGTLIVKDDAETSEEKFRSGDSMSGTKHRGNFRKMLTNFILSHPPGLEDEERNFISLLRSTTVGGVVTLS